MPVSLAPFQRPRTARAGFSLVELMITLVLLAIVVAVIATVMISSQRSKADTEGRIEAQQNGRAISDMIAADIRTAGYGVDTNTIPNQPAFAYVDSVEIMINVNQMPFPDTTAAAASPSNPLALSPTATPLPHKLTGSYLPASQYTTGAETIVYTLDLNNDGVVDANDQAVPLAADAQRTPNPNDFVLARARYGLVGAGNNDGSLQAVGLVRGPGTGIPAMYTVYLNGSSTPWNWHSGAIPANRLKDITSIELQVTTEGRRARSDGTFPRSTLTTEINSIRNQPSITTSLQYHVTGYVFNDLNKNHVKEVGEAGLAGVVLRLGSVATAVTNSLGYYDISGPQSQYILKHWPATGYFSNGPDSLAVDFVANPNPVAHDFPDTARIGGWVNDTCYVDNNLNGVLDAGDTRVDGATVSSGGTSCVTGAGGGASIFLGTGTQSISVAPPDSFQVAGTNPVSVTVVNGGTNVLYTRMTQTGTGTVTGYVFLDTNKNGTKDVGEAGLANAWVGVTANGGVTILGYGYTDNTGFYSIVVANNMPAGTQPYTVTAIPPDGYYPTGTTAISPVWVYTAGIYPNNNFGMVNYTSISLVADRVLALGTANLLEFDWSGNNVNQWQTKGSYDEDLILCSEWVSHPNISVWFNHMDAGQSPVFDTTYTYQVDAQSSALSIATGTIDTAAFLDREDAVTGLAYKASGNIAVWLTQNSPKANCGYFTNTPTLYSTSDGGDVQQVKLQDCAGGTALDLIVGTKSPAAYTGTLEVWRGKGDGTFVRDEIYPGASIGNLPGNRLGEVKALALADVTGDGNKDLLVGTSTADGVGKIHVMQFNSKVAGNRYRAINNYDVVGEVTSLVTTDVDGDGKLDIVIGTRLSSSAGNVQYWRGNGSGNFTLTATFTAPGPVLCLAVGDLGGTSRNDILYGFRTNESSFSGGVRILYTDLGTLPPDDVDPAGGTSNYMTTSIVTWNFNYLVNPSVTPPPYLADFVVAQKPSATTGRLFYYQR